MPERGVLPQDGLLEGHHLRGRVDAQLPGEHGPELPDGAQRLALGAGAVLRKGEQFPAAFAEGGGSHHLVGPGQGLPGAAAAQLRIEQQLLRISTQLEAAGLPACGRPVREVSERDAPPEPEGLLQQETTRSASPSSSSSRAPSDLVLEPPSVEVVDGDAEAGGVSPHNASASSSAVTE